MFDSHLPPSMLFHAFPLLSHFLNSFFILLNFEIFSTKNSVSKEKKSKAEGITGLTGVITSSTENSSQITFMSYFPRIFAASVLYSPNYSFGLNTLYLLPHLNLLYCNLKARPEGRNQLFATGRTY